MISKGSRFGVGSLIRYRASDGLKTVSGDLRLFFGFSSTAQKDLLNEPALQKQLYNEEEALAALLRGDEEGLAYFFLRYHGPLTWFAHSLLHDADTAADITDDAFLKLWERREVLGQAGSIRSWLYTTVRNGCIDHLRREKRKLAYISEAKASTAKEDQPAEHRIIEAETLYQVYKALETLPKKCGQVFKMYYLEEKSLQEIADEMKTSLSTVKSQKGRALELLRKKLPHLGSFFMLL